jgi:predicted nucleotidyltransferase
LGSQSDEKRPNGLVAGMLERAREYNTDAKKPLYVDRLRIFGSYLDPKIDPLGDVDLRIPCGA